MSKLRWAVASALALALLLPATAMAGTKATKCVVSNDGTCVISGDSVVVHLDPQSFARATTGGRSYSGNLASSVDFAFSFTGDIESAVAFASPRLEIPFSNPSGGISFATLDASGCGYSESSSAQRISTVLANCRVLFMGVAYANWDAFVASNPTLRLAQGSVWATVQTNAVPFDVTLSNFAFG